MRPQIVTAALAAMLSAGAAASPQQKPREAPPAFYGYTVVRSYPHDREAFTQGLIFRDGVFYEGTGLEGRSGIRKVKLETGEVLQAKPLSRTYFGEGITEWKGQIVQLTWKSEVAFVYDMKTFEPIKQWTYTGEGWGLTHDGTRLIMSDGSSALRFIDPATLKETGRITVRDANGPVEHLNELEYVKGEIFANVWYTERIARISPKDGRITGWIDLTGLLSAAERGTRDAVLNGIAYDAAGDRLFVTGKLWPRVFEIKLVKRA
jgi:glutaminyl-peptide cyclotransferase